MPDSRPNGGIAESEGRRLRSPEIPYPDESLKPLVISGQRENRVKENDKQLLNLFGPGQPQEPPTPDPAEDDSFLSPAVSDIMRGVLTEIPRAAAYASLEASEEVLQSFDSLADFYTEQFGSAAWLVNPGAKIFQTAQEFEKQLQTMAQGEETAPEPGEEEEGDERILPEIDAPETVTGNVISSLIQFGVGFFPAMRAVRTATGAKSLLSAGGIAQTEAAAAVSSALVFDPHEERLSNLVQEFPTLANPVNDALKADEDDTELEGRMKSAIEGLGVGLAGHAATALARPVVRGVKAIGANRRALNLPSEVDAPLDTSPVVSQLGDPDAPLFGPSTVGAGQLTEEGAGTVPELVGRGVKRKMPFKTNWAKFAETDNIEEALRRTAKVFAKRMDKARRGTISDDKLAELQEQQLEGLARDAGLTPEDIYRIHGTGFKAEEIMAMKWMLETATDDLIGFAKTAASSSDHADLAAFNRMKDIHASMFAYTQGAISETGRSLRASRLPTGSRAKQLSELNAAVTQGGGEDGIRRLAHAVGELDDPELVNKALRGSMGKRLSDAVSQVWYFNLLSGIRTHVVNVTASGTNFAWQTAERAIAARVGAARGLPGSVEVGEASSMWYGATQALTDGLRAAGRGLRDNVSSSGFSKVEQARPQAISSSNFPIGAFMKKIVQPASPEAAELVGRSFDLAIDSLGHITSWAGRGIIGADEFYKTIGRSAQIHSLAMREVKSKGLQGAEAERVYKDLVENPDTLAQESAEAFSSDLTFTSHLGQTGRAFQQAVSSSLAGRLIVPFPRVSINLPKWAAKRTPLGSLSSNIRSQIAAGGAEGDLALARIGLGTMMGMAAADLALKGRVTGAAPFDRELRNSWMQEHKEFNIKLGDTWYGYDRSDPFGLILAASASYAQLAGDLAPAEREDMAGAIVLATTESVLNKTWMLGVTQALDALQDPEMSLERFVQRTAGTLLVPTFASQIRQGIDPVWRETNSILEAAQARVPGYSDSLPAHRDIWGNKMLSQFGFGESDHDIVPESESMLDDTLDFANNFMPFSKFTPPNEPINLWLFENRVGVGRPAKVQMGAELTPEQYSRFVELAGNGLKDPNTGLGLKDTMNSLIEGTHPNSAVWASQTDGPKGGKALMFQSMMQTFRAAARAQLFEEDPEFRSRVEAVAQEEATAVREEIEFPRAGRAPR